MQFIGLHVDWILLCVLFLPDFFHWECIFWHLHMACLCPVLSWWYIACTFKTPLFSISFRVMIDVWMFFALGLVWMKLFWNCIKTIILCIASFSLTVIMHINQTNIINMIYTYTCMYVYLKNYCSNRSTWIEILKWKSHISSTEKQSMQTKEDKVINHTFIK